MLLSKQRQDAVRVGNALQLRDRNRHRLRTGGIGRHLIFVEGDDKETFVRKIPARVIFWQRVGAADEGFKAWVAGENIVLANFRKRGQIIGTGQKEFIQRHCASVRQIIVNRDAVMSGVRRAVAVKVNEELNAPNIAALPQHAVLNFQRASIHNGRRGGIRKDAGLETIDLVLDDLFQIQIEVLDSRVIGALHIRDLCLDGIGRFVPRLFHRRRLHHQPKA